MPLATCCASVVGHDKLYLLIMQQSEKCVAPFQAQEQVPCFIKRIMGAMSPVLIDTLAIEEHIWFTTMSADELLLVRCGFACVDRTLNDFV